MILLDSKKFYTPAGSGSAEITEKRSRFIGLVAPVGSEQEAVEEIARVKACYHDARHHCWCYIIRGNVERYSDDGEPQGSAGLPMLEVFRRAGIVDMCCVVTRYFGGTLLGTGGLSRAYSGTAALALNDAGIAEFRLFECMSVELPYNLLGGIKTDVENIGGVVVNVEYGENVLMQIHIPDGYADAINKRLADISAGAVRGVVTGKTWAGSGGGE